MEDRKKEEIEYYDRAASQHLREEVRESGSLGGFNPFVLGSYKFLQDYLEDRSQGKKILDYGCGTGIHLSWLAKTSKEVVGIDLSSKALEMAREKIKTESLSNKAKVMIIDCEKMEFPDSSFDIIFDGGTFSSLDLNKALPGLAKALKSEGFLIGIETLGHNPLTNLKRKLNKLIGKRTKWAAEHIFKMEDLRLVEKYFNKILEKVGKI